MLAFKTLFIHSQNYIFLFSFQLHSGYITLLLVFFYCYNVMLLLFSKHVIKYIAFPQHFPHKMCIFVSEYIRKEKKERKENEDK
jgi:hypothetical protein